MAIQRRTECHSMTIKYLRKLKLIKDDEKDVKVDLILFSQEHGDIFSCEEKPTSASSKEVESDLLKSSKARESQLQYLNAVLPVPETTMEHIEVLSAQLHGLNLKVYGSRMIRRGNDSPLSKGKDCNTYHCRG